MIWKSITLFIVLVYVHAGFVPRQDTFNDYLRSEITNAPPLDSARTPILHPPSSPPRYCHEKHHDHRDHPKNKHLFESDEGDESENDSRYGKNYRDGKKFKDQYMNDEAEMMDQMTKMKDANGNYKFKINYNADDDSYYNKETSKYNTKYDEKGSYGYENPKYDYNYDEFMDEKKQEDRKPYDSRKSSKGRGGKSLKDDSSRLERKNRKIKFATHEHNDFHGVVNKSGNGLHLFRVRQGEASRHDRFF